MRNFIARSRSPALVLTLCGSLALTLFVQSHLTSLGVLSALLLLFAVWKIPQWYVSTHVEELSPESALQVETTARKTIIELVGGVGLLIGLAFTWQNLQNTQRATVQTLDRTREGQVTDRFVRSVEQLGSRELPVRVGAIYSLDRIASESNRDVRPIVEILSAYIRDRRSWPGELAIEDIRRKYKLRSRDAFGVDSLQLAFSRTRLRISRQMPLADIQAALSVIAARWAPNGEHDRLDLTASDLRGVSIARSRLTNVNFSFADLRDADLSEGMIASSSFGGAMMMASNLSHTVFKKVLFINADLRDVNFEDVRCENCAFLYCDLRHADFINADLTSATFQQSDARGTDFREAKGLTTKQLNEDLRTDASTSLPLRTRDEK